MQRLKKHAGQPLIGVGYTSTKFREVTATKPEDIQGMAEMAKTLAGLAGLAEDQQKALSDDIDALAKSISGGLVKPGAITSFSFRTSRGWESFCYDDSPISPISPRPLTLLNHVGGSPLFACVWRSQTTVEDYRAFIKWVKVFAGHGEKILVDKVPDSKEYVQAYREQVLPVLKELDQITEKLWLPALADGQEGIVLDGKWSSRKWFRDMPDSNKPLPLPELGVVLGLSDKAKMEQPQAHPIGRRPTS